MEKTKYLDSKFNEVSRHTEAHYGIHSNGDVELFTDYDTAYPLITREEIQKLAEITKERNR